MFSFKSIKNIVHRLLFLSFVYFPNIFLLSVSDSVSVWSGLHHWLEEDSPLLFPETEAQKLRLLSRRRGFSSTKMASYWHASGDLWLCASI